jgi:predicted phage terminase large subunit-like protein
MSPTVAALLRLNFAMFLRKAFLTVSLADEYLPNWHIDAIVYQLDCVGAGKVKRLIINQPPRSLKSIAISVAYVAWRLGHDPKLRVLVASYSAELAAELHRQFRMVVKSDWYQELFPNLVWKKETNVESVTSREGGRYATSVGGTLTGRGADLIIVDDPLNAAEAHSETARKKLIDWFGGTLVSRLNDKTRDPIIVVAQRLHEDDLPGHLLRAGGWQHLCLAAIAAERDRIPIGPGRYHTRQPGEALHEAREPLDVLEQIKAEIGSLKFSAQYQQQPVPADGNLVRREWFKPYDALPPRAYNTRLVQSWDVAATSGNSSDYSVCTTWLVCNGDFYVINVFRERLTYPALRRKLIELAKEYDAQTILIEDAGFGLNLLQDLSTEKPDWLPHPLGIKPLSTKLERLEAQTAKIEAGHLRIPKEAHWLGAFLHEMLAFPNARHDDQVDTSRSFCNGRQFI